MITLQGTPRVQGIAIAVAAVVDIRRGIDGVSPELLQSGIDALRKGLDPVDFPEAVVACDNLAFGGSFRVPGVRTIGIAVQSGGDSPGLEVDMPCVVEVENLLKSISDGDIMIIDGDKGIVHIDPDPPTLIHYQHILEKRVAPPRIFITSEHLPAKMQSGEVVNVYACVSNQAELTLALDAGADGFLVDVRGSEFEFGRLYPELLSMATGKPAAFAAEFAPRDLLHAAMRHAAPWQVTLLLSQDNVEESFNAAVAELEAVTTEAFLDDLQPPQIGMGVFASDPLSLVPDGLHDISWLFVDLRRFDFSGGADHLRAQALMWMNGRQPEQVVAVIGEYLEMIGVVVNAGARNVAVTPNMVTAAKYHIRSIGLEEA